MAIVRDPSLPIGPAGHPIDWPDDVVERFFAEQEAREEDIEERNEQHTSLVEMAAFRKIAGQYAAPTIEVECPVDGYTNLTATYHVGIPFKIAARIYALPDLPPSPWLEKPENFDYEEWAGRYADWVAARCDLGMEVLIDVQPWNLCDLEGNPIEHPRKGGAKSLASVMLVNQELGNWLTLEGYNEALRIKAGNASGNFDGS